MAFHAEILDAGETSLKAVWPKSELLEKGVSLASKPQVMPASRDWEVVKLQLATEAGEHTDQNGVGCPSQPCTLTRPALAQGSFA